MSEIFSVYYQNILNWRATFKKLPRASVFAGLIFMLVGILGFIAGLLFFSDKPVAYSILLIMGIASSIWFIIMRRKLVKMELILKDLNLLVETEVFTEIIEKVIEIRRNAEIKDKPAAIQEYFIEKDIKSKELHLELNRIAIEIQRVQARTN